MTSSIDAILVVLILLNLAMLGTSRLGVCIRLVAMQGVGLGLLTLFINQHDLVLRVVLLAVGSMVVKGIALPLMLYRAQHEAAVRHEVEPYVGYTLSILAGVVALAVSLWLGTRLPLPSPAPSSLVVPVAIFTILVGLFLIVSRKKAITQVMGYLVLENGIYTFGISMAHQEPWLVEMGVILDVFVAVFVMGIAIFHISREFDSIDVDRLSALSDWKETKP